MWQTRFGGDPGIVGKSIRLDEGRRTIVGVMSPDFEIPDLMSRGPVHLWSPLDTDDPKIV